MKTLSIEDSASVSSSGEVRESFFAARYVKVGIHVRVGITDRAVAAEKRRVIETKR